MLEKFKITLASQSPRRHELLAGLDIKFSIEANKDEEEIYSEDIPSNQVPEFLARHKSESFHRKLEQNEILITADTLVFCKNEILGKPKDRKDAENILAKLSGKKHRVLTGVALRSNYTFRSFTSTTEVTFKKLSNDEIKYYLDNYKPYDKAGSYGVQEWIGYIGITSIKGSYFNVMGLPVQKLYTELMNFNI